MEGILNAEADEYRWLQSCSTEADLVRQQVRAHAQREKWTPQQVLRAEAYLVACLQTGQDPDAATLTRLLDVTT
jgi:hypothetical protein